MDLDAPYRLAENTRTYVYVIISWGKQNAEDLMRGYLITSSLIHPAHPDLSISHLVDDQSTSQPT